MALEISKLLLIKNDFISNQNLTDYLLNLSFLNLFKFWSLGDDMSQTRNLENNRLQKLQEIKQKVVIKEGLICNSSRFFPIHI